MPIVFLGNGILTIVIVVTVAPSDAAFADANAVKLVEADAVKISDADAATLKVCTAAFDKRGMLRIRERTLRRQYKQN